MAALLAACGDENSDNPPGAPASLHCVSCGATSEDATPQEVAPSPRLEITPVELMFYGYLSQEAVEPQSVVVANLTPGAVAVYEAHVQDAPSALGEGGAKYFDVSQLDSPAKLDSGDTLVLWVSFARSAEQRHAQLVITTSDERQPTLLVALWGKYLADAP